MLLGLSALVYYFDHTPIVLWFFMVATFTSATLANDIGLVQYWELIKGYWSEFKDQEEIAEECFLSDGNAFSNKASTI